MKKFNTPVVEVINFQVEDIICVSNNEFSGEGSGGFPVETSAPAGPATEKPLPEDEFD